jgi:predicted dinucleotide-binding enzyme
MKVGIIGAGRIGGGVARQLAGAGHEVLLSFSRDPQSLAALAAEMEAPRRPGAAYGEEYRAPDAPAVVEAVRTGQRIPPAPQY